MLCSYLIGADGVVRKLLTTPSALSKDAFGDIF